MEVEVNHQERLRIKVLESLRNIRGRAMSVQAKMF